jgi:hypothetical protein
MQAEQKLPSGFPAVISDGVEALDWAGSAVDRALLRVSEWVAELKPSTDQAIAEARERAKRESELHVYAFRDSAGWKREFTRLNHDLAELSNRLKHRTKDEWTSGSAANYFTGLDVSLLRDWSDGAYELLLQWLGESAEQIKRGRSEFGALAQWLEKYLATNA